MADHVDFELDWATGADIGFKLVAINVSDIAAMGGRPTRAVATLQLGTETTPELIEEMAGGMSEAAARWGFSIVGGDIGRGTDLAMSMMLLGEADGEPVLRSGAQPGDSICVTGALGGAEMGLMALQAGVVDKDSLRAEIQSGSGADGLAVVAARQVRPTPRLEEGIALREHASAMIDISDGLALDLERLCVASKVGCEVDTAKVPLHPELHHAMQRLGGPMDIVYESGSTGGEDFELLFTVPDHRLDVVHEALDELGTSVSVLGKITTKDRLMDGRPLREWSKHAWDHLRTR
jgi:thiamine-monophosphate kinase